MRVCVQRQFGGCAQRLRAECIQEGKLAVAEQFKLVVVGEGEQNYVIGVLRGQGHTRLTFEGDVSITARNGDLRLRADRALSLGAPDVSVDADRLTLVAEAAHKIVGTLRQTVRELFTLRAKEHHTLVEGNVLSHSKGTRIVSEEKVTIIGKEIFLG